MKGMLRYLENRKVRVGQHLQAVEGAAKSLPEGMEAVV